MSASLHPNVTKTSTPVTHIAQTPTICNTNPPQRNITVQEVAVREMPELIGVTEKVYVADGRWWAKKCIGRALCEAFGRVHFMDTETAELWRMYIEWAVQRVVWPVGKIIADLKVNKYNCNMTTV